MNNGPTRGQRPIQGRAAAPEARQRVVPMSTAAQPAPSQPQPMRSEPTSAVRPQVPHRGAGRQTEKKPAKRVILAAAIGGVLVVAIVGGWLTWSAMQGMSAAIKSDQYQAVFFSNGQVYFGKLHAFNGESMRLTNVYYLQNQSSDGSTSSDNPQSSSGSNAKLIKLGDEIHAPDDEMIIPKSQIQFYENIKADGQVAQLMKKYEASN